MLLKCFPVHTVFIRIVAAATINFSLAGVQLLIEGGSYSRVAFINFGPIPHGVVYKKRTTRLVYECCTTNNGYMLTKEATTHP